MSLGTRLRLIGRALRDGARAMAGIPSYDTYLAQMRSAHPDVAPMTYAAFFRDRQRARYGSSAGRCC